MTFISGFSEGMFGGAKSIMSMYGMMQQAKLDSFKIKAGDDVAAATQGDKDDTAAVDKWNKDYAAGGGDPNDANAPDGSSAIDTTVDPKTGKTVTPGSRAEPASGTAPDANAVPHPDSSPPKKAGGLDEALEKIRRDQRTNPTATPREMAGATRTTTPAGNQQAIETGVAPVAPPVMQREDRADTTTPPMSPRELAQARLTPKGDNPIAPSNLPTYDQPPQGMTVPPPQYGPPNSQSGPEPVAPPASATATALPTGAAAPTTQGQPSLGARILSSLNPIGSAQAAPVAPAPAGAAPATPGAPTPAPAPAGAAPAAPAGAASAAPAATALPPPGSKDLPGNTPPPGAPPTTVADKTTVPQPSSGSLPPDVAAAQVTLPTTKANEVTPGQTTPSTQSEQTPQAVKPPMNPRPYMALAQQSSPANKQLVDQIADEEHVSPERLALHWWQESRLHDTSGEGKAGERGIMQMLPATQAGIDPRHTLDINTKEGALRLSARLIHQLDSRYGQDSPLSVGAYQGGPASADAIAAGYGAQHPNTVKYMAESFPGQKLDYKSLGGAIKIDAQGAIKAGTESGPDGFLHFIAQSGPAGSPMTDKWRAAESSLMALAASRGDIEGMRHASDFVLQMSQQGSTTSLMNAYNAMQAGDGTTAAQQLARAYAFFPDGAMGRFGVDAKGQVFGQRVDENDPSQAIGGHFQITPEALLGKMAQTRDPSKFAQMIQEQQKQTQAVRFQQQHGQYYAEKTRNEQEGSVFRHEDRQEANRVRDVGIQTAADAKIEAAKIAADAKTDAAAIRIGGGAGAAPDPAKVTGVDKEVSTLYGPAAQQQGTMTPDQNAMASQLHYDLRVNAASHALTSPEANRVSVGLATGKLSVNQGADGRYGVYPKGATGGTPQAFLSESVVNQLRAFLQPGAGKQALPVGPPPATVVSPNASALPSAMPTQGIQTSNMVH